MRELERIRKEVRTIFPYQAFVVNYYHLTDKTVHPHELFLGKNIASLVPIDICWRKIIELGFAKKSSKLIYAAGYSGMTINEYKPTSFYARLGEIPLIHESYPREIPLTITTIFMFLKKYKRLCIY